MFKLLCVTNRNLCHGDFLKRVEQLAACHPAGILLREKDLSEADYRALAAKVLDICKEYQTPCILHTFVEAALELEAPAIHLPLPVLYTMSKKQKDAFISIGASCHSTEDAKKAEALGCTYLTAGHIFETDCKKGLPGRGLGFLKELVPCVNIPVYAIGGIDRDNIQRIENTGAKGACIMSGAMQCDNVAEYFEGFEGKI